MIYFNILCYAVHCIKDAMNKTSLYLYVYQFTLTQIYNFICFDWLIHLRSFYCYKTPIMMVSNDCQSKAYKGIFSFKGPFKTQIVAMKFNLSHVSIGVPHKQLLALKHIGREDIHVPDHYVCRLGVGGIES